MELHSIGNTNPHTMFEEKFLHVLHKQAPLKTNLLQYNNNALMPEK